MARSKFPCEVLTPEGEVFSDEVEMVSTRTTLGEIGVLANHAPVLGMLEPTELRVYRANKVGHDGARRMEELEGEVSRLEVERDSLKNRGAAAATAPDNAKLKQALELAATTAETAASLNDVLSSLRIEVMAAEGALDQYAQALPRASYDLIRQSLRDAAGHCDEARDILRKLRDTAG